MDNVVHSAFFDELQKISQSAFVNGLLEAMDKIAESLGFEAARRGNGVNPTLVGVNEANSVYSSLHPDLQKMIESHPLVAQHGMSPQAALQVAHWTAQKKGQSLPQFFMNEHLKSTPGASMPTTPKIAPAAAGTMATVPGKAISKSFVTKATAPQIAKPVSGIVNKAVGAVRRAPGLQAIASGALH